MNFKQRVLKSTLPFHHIFAVVKFDLVASIFFLGVPFKCKEDVMPNNEWVQLCQDGAAVKPKYVSIFEGSSFLTFSQKAFRKDVVLQL